MSTAKESNGGAATDRAPGNCRPRPRASGRTAFPLITEMPAEGELPFVIDLLAVLNALRTARSPAELSDFRSRWMQPDPAGREADVAA